MIGAVALKINRAESFHDTVIAWFRLAHPTQPLDRVILYEDEEPSGELIDPFSIRVVFFLDYEWDTIQVVSVNGLIDNNPLNPPIRTKVIIAGDNGNCTMDDLVQRIHWLESNPSNVCFPDDPLLEHTTRRVLACVIDDFSEEERVFRSLDIDPSSCSLPVIQPTLADRQAFHVNHPNVKILPLEWYEVSMDQLSSTLALKLPLYECMKVHISQIDLNDYLWVQFTHSVSRIKSAMWMKDELHDQLVFLKSKISHKKHKPQESVEIIDVEDLGKLLPPCFSNLKRYPMDQHRQYLVRIIRGANISLSSAERVLDELNNMFPHPDGALTLKRRWDYEAHYKKGYKAPNCEKMGEYCRFIGDSVDKKKMQCHEKFKKSFPSKYKESDGPHFYGPKNWLQWVIRKEQTEQLE